MYSVSALSAGGVALAFFYGASPSALSATAAVAGGAVSGAVMGFLITPDIDHPWYTVEEQRIAKGCGPAALVLWSLFWLPFVAVRHRSKITHSWPLATALKQLWLTAWALVVVFVLNYALGVSVPLREEDLAYMFLAWLAMFLGWSVQDLVHLVLDGKILRGG